MQLQQILCNIFEYNFKVTNVKVCFQGMCGEMMEWKGELYIDPIHISIILKELNYLINGSRVENKLWNRHFMFVGSPIEGKKRENRVFVNISTSIRKFFY